MLAYEKVEHLHLGFLVDWILEVQSKVCEQSTMSTLSWHSNLDLGIACCDKWYEFCGLGSSNKKRQSFCPISQIIWHHFIHLV